MPNAKPHADNGRQQRTLSKSKIVKPILMAIGALGMTLTATAQAANWSDNSLSWRYGTKFAEPYEGNDITKNILNFTSVSGFKYGTNFVSIDGLFSNSKDPSSPWSNNGATEVYAVYRNTLDIGKIAGKDLGNSFIRGYGVTSGFDFNVKDDAGYNSRKRMLVLGPTVMFNIPHGFLNVSLLGLWESNAPCNEFTNTCVSRYRYKTHPMLSAAWSVPFGSLPLAFEGFANFIAPKGKDEFGNQTKTEIDIDAQVMADVGKILGGPANTFKLGLEYQYWKNKFGNDANGPAGSGAFAKTPMVRAEYHF